MVRLYRSRPPHIDSSAHIDVFAVRRCQVRRGCLIIDRRGRLGGRNFVVHGLLAIDSENRIFEMLLLELVEELLVLRRQLVVAALFCGALLQKPVQALVHIYGTVTRRQVEDLAVAAFLLFVRDDALIGIDHCLQLDQKRVRHQERY